MAPPERRVFFVRRQVITTLGLLVSTLATRFLLGTTSFPEGCVRLFAAAPVFLAAAPTAALAVLPVRRIDCGDWYRVG